MVPLYVLFPVVSAFTTSHFEAAGDVTRFGTYGLVLVMVFLGPLAHFKSGSLASLWSLVSYLMCVRWFGALNVSTGRYLSIFQTCIGESLAPRNVLHATGGKEISQEKIKTLGVETALFVHNSGQLLLGLAVAVLALIAVSILGKGEGESFFHVLKRKFQYSLLIVVVFLSFQDLLIYAFLQAQYVDFSSAASVISVLLSFAFLLFSLVCTLFVPVMICKGLVSFKSSHFVYYSKWGSLVEDMKSGMSLPRYQYFSIYLLQRWIAAILYVFMDSLAQIQVVGMLILEAFVVVWMLYARPYQRAIDTICITLLHANIGLLLLFEACFLQSWNEKGEMFLAFAFIATYLFGIGICLVRFGVNLYFKKDSPAPEPQTAITDISSTELKSHKANLPDETDRVLSQKPSDPYKKMPTLTPPLQAKRPNQVHPVTPATPTPSVAPSTQTGLEDAGSWVSRWSRFKAPVH